MKIVVYGMDFSPQPVGIAVYTTDMCRFFAAQGHSVRAIVGFPYYPQLELSPQDVGAWYRTDVIDAVVVQRCRVMAPSAWTTRGRAIREILFAMTSMPRLLAMGRPDVVVVISPPFGPAVAAAHASGALGIPVAVHVQDIQPDAAVELGMMRSKPLLGLLRAAERRLYHTATLVTTLDETMRARIVEKGVPAAKVAVFPNWVDAAPPNADGSAEGFRAAHGLSDKSLVVYSGSMGVKQGLELVLDVAACALEREDVRFLLAGDGPVRKELASAASRRGLANITFLPPQSDEQYAALLAAADLCLLPQRPEVRSLVMPSKVLRMLAGGVPIVAIADKESGLADVIRRSGGGTVMERRDAPDVWATVRNLIADGEARARMASAGRRYAATHFDRDAVLTAYLDRLLTLTRDR